MSDELVRDGGFENSPWWFTDSAKVDVSCQRTGQYAARVNLGGQSGTVSSTHLHSVQQQIQIFILAYD